MENENQALAAGEPSEVQAKQVIGPTAVQAIDIPKAKHSKAKNPLDRVDSAGAPPSNGRSVMTLFDLTEKFLAHFERAGKSAGTIASYRAELVLAMSELGAQTALSELSVERVDGYFKCRRVTRLKSGKSKAKPSIDKTRRVLRLALVYAADRGWIQQAPLPTDDKAK